MLKRKIAKKRSQTCQSDIMGDYDSSSVNIDTSSESENKAGLSIVSTQRHKFRGKVTEL